jgi:soluble P-type ATPase
MFWIDRLDTTSPAAFKFGTGQTGRFWYSAIVFDTNGHYAYQEKPMIYINIPGVGKREIHNIVFDYNGTIAIDGVLIPGVKEAIRSFAGQAAFHVITADTFGFVTDQVSDIDCKVIIIPTGNQAKSKRDFIAGLGARNTLCAGNGANDELMLKHAAVGIAVMQEEGLATAALFAADLVVKDILDVFALLKTPERIMATLRQ